MTLNDIYKRPLGEILAGMNTVDLKIHTGDDGTIKSIEVKYIPPDTDGTVPLSPKREWY